MNAVLGALAAALTSPSLAIVLALAAVILVGMGVGLRRRRVHGKLTFASASTSAAAASLVLATALLASAAIGAPTHAVAAPIKAHQHTDTPPQTPDAVNRYLPIPLDDLEGYQLPTR